MTHELMCMAPILAEHVQLDGAKGMETIVEIGGTSIVIQQGESAVKIPLISRTLTIEGVPVVNNGRLTPEGDGHDVRPDLIRAIENEKAIYKRLGNHSEMVHCYNFASDHHSVQMDVNAEGSSSLSS